MYARENGHLRVRTKGTSNTCDTRSSVAGRAPKVAIVPMKASGPDQTYIFGYSCQNETDNQSAMKWNYYIGSSVNIRIDRDRHTLYSLPAKPFQ